MPDANWYPDPAGSGGQRWWDGNGWTDQTRPTPPPQPQPFETRPFDPQPPAHVQPQPFQPQPFEPQPPAHVQPQHGHTPHPAPWGPGAGPNPPAAAGPVGEPAPYLSRVAAYLVDGALIALPAVLAMVANRINFAVFGETRPYYETGQVLTGPGRLISLVLLVPLLLGPLAVGLWNAGLRQGRTGQSVGKSLMGLRLGDLETGQNVGPGRAVGRFALFGALVALCGIPALVDLLWPLWDRDDQRLVDKAVHTRVRRAP